MKKKIFSILLSLCMVLTMIPMATGTVWAEGTSVATSVTIGGLTLSADTPYYHNGTDGAVGTVDNLSEGANATFDSDNGKLTLNGLNLTSGKISATGDLTILLTGKNWLGSKTYSSNVIYVNNGKLAIVGPGALTVNNGNNEQTTIYAAGNITINDGARVTATHAGGGAQAIHANGSDQGQITISGAGTEVTATHNGTDSNPSENYVALRAGTIRILDGAKLTAKGQAMAVNGTLSVDNLTNYKIYAGDSQDSADEQQNLTGDLTALSTYKYLEFEPQTAAPTALEDVTFGFAYDVQRSPAFPSSVNQNIQMYDFQNPLIDYEKNRANTNTGKWKLTKTGTYSYVKSQNKNSTNLDSIVDSVSSNYNLNKETIVIHELKENDEHIAYGVVIAYDETNRKAAFLGDTWTDGACYLLSESEIAEASTYTSSKPFKMNAGKIATDFVQKISISLDTTGTYTFPTATAGYEAQTLKTVTVTNTGNAETGELKVALSGTHAANFTLSADTISSIDVKNTENNQDGTATFTVTPNTGLAEGTYTATVTVIGQNIVSQSFDVSFTVNKASSGGGSHSSSIQKPTIIADEGAETSLSFLGTNLTIKMTEGYELTDVILNGVSKGKVTELTGLRTGDKVEVKTEKKQEKPTKEEIIADLDSSKLVARSKLITLENGKKAVRVTWYDKNGKEIDFDGVEVYRSVKRYKGYGLKPFYTTKGDKSEGYYVNTKDLKEGTTYYYKVRGYVTIDGQKYYTDYSDKAWRTIK